MNKKGFSLLELMIVLAVATVGATLAFPSFIAWKNKSAVREEARNLHATLRRVQMEAIQTGCRFAVVFDLGNKEYSVVRRNWGNCTGETRTPHTIEDNVDFTIVHMPNDMIDYEQSGMLEADYVSSLTSSTDGYPVKVRFGNEDLVLGVDVSHTGAVRVRR